ncbi:hypothetical protein [Gemmatimonas sp.]|uniref:hypothetical protein n=1 Tax=Gemmatimonas sp. TaxID=1962908 RepID=UPI003F705744
MPLFSRWVIEANDGPPGTNLWIVAGSVVGAKDSADAIRQFQSSGPDIDRISLLRAIPWDSASEDQREIAGMQDERRGVPIGGMFGRGSSSEVDRPWERDYEEGKLPIWANTASKALLYALLRFIVSWGTIILIVVGLYYLVRAIFF